MADEYATLRAAFHAGATIQAYTLFGLSGTPVGISDEGSIPLNNLLPGAGYWRDLSCEGEPRFSCHPTRYRCKPEGAE